MSIVGCSSCPSNRVSIPGSPVCCPVGMFLRQGVFPTCDYCPEGFYADPRGADKCSPCPAGTTAKPFSSSCTNVTTTLGSTSTPGTSGSQTIPTSTDTGTVTPGQVLWDLFIAVLVSAAALTSCYWFKLYIDSLDTHENDFGNRHAPLPTSDSSHIELEGGMGNDTELEGGIRSPILAVTETEEVIVEQDSVAQKVEEHKRDDNSEIVE